MSTGTTRDAVLASLIAVFTLAGCADTPSSPPSAALGARFDVRELSVAPLVQHLVPPQLTDPAIDRFLDDHYVWLDTTVQANHRLLVFMAGTGQRPAQFQLFEQEAARLGYNVIGLSYVNSGGLAKVCPLALDPGACYEQARLEVIDGVERSSVVNVNQANSIDNRLTKLLLHLAAQYPEEGWSQFLGEGDSAPQWPLIAVGGLSVGGGEAAMIAKIRLVARVIMFSSVPDSVGAESVPWVAEHVTPVNRYYGLAHDRDGFFAPIQAGWDSLGMTAFGSAVAVESGDPPYRWTHMLFTDVTPVGGFVGLNAHASPATDAVTPLAADGTPLLRDAWDYLLTGLPRRPGIGADIVARQDER